MKQHLKAGIFAALIGLLPALGTTDARATETVRVASSAAICFCFLPAAFGEKLGIWDKYGITIDMKSMGGDARVQQAILAGAIDIGLGSGPGIGALSKGVPAKAVAAIMYRPAGMALIGKAYTPIKSAADLKGRKIGVTTGGSLTEWLARRAATSAGIDLKDVKIVPLGDLSSNTAALMSGSTDAMVYGSEAGFGMQVKGTGKVIATFDQIVPHFVAHAIFASDKYRAEKPEVVRNFVKGWLEVIDYMRSHKDETVEFASANLQLPRDVAALIYDVNLPQFTRDGKFPDDALDILDESFVELGILPAKVDVKALIDTRFLPVH